MTNLIKTISILIPTYKSEKNIPVLVEKLENILSKSNYHYEILFVDDCSPDNSLEILRAISSETDTIRVISLSRNFGQQIAITAGLTYVKGDAVITMDDDLQDPPELIPEFLEKWEEGYDVVYAIRKSRTENIFKRLGYSMFYRILSFVSQGKVPVDSGDFGLVDKKIVCILNKMTERDRFLRGMRAWIGFRQIGVEFERDSRYKGKSAYNFWKIIKLSLDGIISTSNMPLKFSTTVGFAVSTMAFIGAIITLIQKIITYYYPDSFLSVYPGFSTIVLSILFLGGVQLISIGLLGEYIARVYNDVKGRPLFLIKEIIGFENNELHYD